MAGWTAKSRSGQGVEAFGQTIWDSRGLCSYNGDDTLSEAAGQHTVGTSLVRQEADSLV
jgi:hypothetical protein